MNTDEFRVTGNWEKTVETTQVKVIVIADDSGHISVETEGPLRGKSGLLALLAAATELAEQMTDR